MTDEAEGEGGSEDAQVGGEGAGGGGSEETGNAAGKDEGQEEGKANEDGNAEEETLPQFSPLISDATVRAVAAKAPSNLPAFRFVGPVREADVTRVTRT